MEFHLTDNHVKRMAAAAINASKAVGLGWMHFDKTATITVDDVHIIQGDNQLSIDYYQGRMVKFHARRIDKDKWNFSPDNLTPDYQSWCEKYPTWEHLFEATNV